MPTTPVSFWDDVRPRLSTPEQVDLRLEVANNGSRGLALMIDLSIRYGVFFALFYLYGILVSLQLVRVESTLGLKGLALLLVFVVFLSEWLYFALFEWLWNGQTPGKRAMGLRVIKVDGSPVGWVEAVLRNFTRPIDSVGPMALVGMAFIFFQPRAQRPGDLVARTIVIRETPIDWKSFFPDDRTALDETTAPQAALPLTPVEVELLQRYRQRAGALEGSRRDELAAQIRTLLQPRARGTELEQSSLRDLEWLEAVARRL